MMNIFIENNVLEIICKYLTPKEIEKNLFGEVFTPLCLVCEMLDLLPKSVWLNPDLKWLDPANGIGNYPIVVYYKLMQSLTVIDESIRSKHIIENMIYMNELNPVNVALCKNIFKIIDPDAEPNIHTGDFFTDYGKLLPDGEKFDVIMGNPPFNTEFSAANNKPYMGFTLISINILEPLGYLLFITPPTIYYYLIKVKRFIKCKNVGFSYNEMLNITHINCNIEYLQQFFPQIGSRFFYFLLKNEPYKNKTEIINYNDKTMYTKEINLGNNDTNDLKYIQNINEPLWVSVYNKILSKTTERKFQKAIFDTNHTQRIRKKSINDGIISETKDNKYKYQILKSYNIKNNALVPKKLYYFDKTDTDYGQDKLIIMESYNLYPHIIKKNTYTLSDIIWYLRCTGNDGFNIKKILDSPLGKSIFTPTGSNVVFIKNYLERLHIPDIEFTTNESIYNFYELNENEIAFLQN